MVRTSKNDKQSAAPAPVPAQVEQPVVAEKAPKQRVKKVKAVDAAPAPEPVVDNVQVAVELTVDETSADAKLSEFKLKFNKPLDFYLQ